MKLNIQPISQKDSRWGMKKLGTSSVTISGYGCVLTCLSMMLKHFGHEQTPDVLNELFKSNDVYHQGNLVYWWGIQKIYPDVVFDERYECLDLPCDLSKIDKYLDKKIPVIAKVDFSPQAGVQMHFVLIIGKENDSYLINDPFSGETYFFESKYGDPARYIYGLRLFTGEPKENENDEDKINDLETKVKSLTEELAGVRLELNNERDLKRDQELDNKDLSRQLTESRNQRDTAIREKEIFEKKSESLESEVSSQVEEIAHLKSTLLKPLSLKLRELGLFKVLKLYFTKGGEK